MITFKHLSTITALITSVLFLVLLFTPGILFTLFQIQMHDSASFISRRAAMLFLCIAIILWLNRKAIHSEARQSICIALSISMLALSLLGIFEYIRGFAGVGIFLAIITEILLSLGYFQIYLRYKKA